MSRADLDVRATQLRGQGVPFVRARVVLAEKPTSAKPGDQAIIHADGSIEGFVGGTCAETTVRAQSLMLLDSKQPLLLRITPTEDADQGTNGVAANGSMTVHNPCLSGGTLEIFLEPVVPAPLVLIHGDGPVAQALREIGGQLEYRVAGVTPGAVVGALAVVVASHGRDEIEVLSSALDAHVPYIALVASRRRGSAVLTDLAQVRPDLATDVDRVHSPAGLDIGARTAAEIALSILAEVVAARVRSPSGTFPPPVEPAATTAIDPVCGMTVAAVETSLHLDHGGRRVYLCGPGCLRAFSADPAGYSEP